MRQASGATLAILGLLLTVHVEAGDEKGERFAIAGICTIETPGTSFEWKQLQTKEIGGIKGHICLCKNEDGSAVMVMIVEERTADSDAKRSPTLKGHWNSLVGLKDSGYTDLKGKPPSFQPPIPDQVTYGFTAKDKAGADTFIHGVTVFGKHTYGFQILTKSKADADKLLATIKTLKEAK